MTAREPERLRAALGETGHADGQATAESVSRTHTDTSGAMAVRFTVAQAEALTDAVPGTLNDYWPDEWPAHGEACKAALAAVKDVLNGEAEEVDCLACLRYAVDIADHALHGALIRAARDADHVILGDRLHVLDGCHVARKAHPVVTGPGGYRGRRLPVFVTRAEGTLWLSADRRRRRCKPCWPSRCVGGRTGRYH